MANAILERIAAEQAEIEGFISTLTEQAVSENRDLVATELDTVKKYEQRMADLSAQAEPIIAYEARRASAIDVSRLAQPQREGLRLPQGQREAEIRSLGELWTQSDAFKSYVGRGSSDALVVPLDRVMQMRAMPAGGPLLTTTNPEGLNLAPEAYKFRGPERFVQFPLLNLVSRVEVSTNSVEWVMTGDASGADEVNEGAAKPGILWTTSTGNITLKTIAGWFKYSRQAAEDIPALRDLVDQKIRRAVDVKLNALAVAALTGAKVAGNTTTGGSGVKMLEVIRIAMAEAEERGVVPSAVALNPADAAGIDIALLGATLNGAVVNRGVFGMQIVPLSAVTAGTAIVGDIADAVTWFYRNSFTLYTTDSDISGAGATASSDFRSNLLTTLGEVRGAFAVTDASALQFAVTVP